MKNKLRKYLLEKRKTIDHARCSSIILAKLFSLEEYKRSKNIICYYPLKYEVNVIPCFKDTTKNWFLPRVNGENLEICPYCKEKLLTGHFNILEPQTDKINTTKYIDMIIIPAVAADRKGYRLGYGKGYYDRFLKKNKNIATRVVLTYSNLFTDNVFHDEFDEKCDIVITEEGIYKC